MSGGLLLLSWVNPEPDIAAATVRNIDGASATVDRDNASVRARVHRTVNRRGVRSYWKRKKHCTCNEETSQLNTHFEILFKVKLLRGFD